MLVMIYNGPATDRNWNCSTCRSPRSIRVYSGPRKISSERITTRCVKLSFTATRTLSFGDKPKRMRNVLSCRNHRLGVFEERLDIETTLFTRFLKCGSPLRPILISTAGPFRRFGEFFFRRTTKNSLRETTTVTLRTVRENSSKNSTRQSSLWTFTRINSAQGSGLENKRSADLRPNKTIHQNLYLNECEQIIHYLCTMKDKRNRQK